MGLRASSRDPSLAHSPLAFAFYFYLGLSTSVIASVAHATGPEWRAKVDPWVLETSEGSSETEFLVFLAEQADLREAALLPLKEQKGRYVFQRLTAVAARTQPLLLQALERKGVSHRAYWIANMIWVRGDRRLVKELASRGDVAHLYANPKVRLPDLPSPSPGMAKPSAIEWNISKVRAPGFWAAGVTGQNVVVAGQDTGYEWAHAAIQGQYRGWDGAVADHNYNWHDAIHTGNGGSCGLDSPVPCDDHGHGTHTMGTMVGDDGAGNQVGMAPGSTWIGCRNMDVGAGTPTTYSECFQWFVAPTDLNDQNADPTKAPHVINNSWGCPPSEGCTDPNVLLTVVENARAAGIVVVVSAGNSGSSCSTVSDPAAIYDASFSVGATDSSDSIAGFSSRGPVTVDGSNRLKPDISAPGVGVRSALRGGGYTSLSGTSMAGPHVAGQTALLISAEPALAGNVNAVEQCIIQTAVPKTSTQTCGGIPGSQIPNNTFGYGRIDLVWPLPDVCLPYSSYKLDATPKILGVCAPNPGNFTVALTSVNGFAEPVTLAATGQPAGTMVTFNVNPLTPPASTGMTIGNTAAGSAGSYTIQIAGDSDPTHVLKSDSVEFFLAKSPPAAPTLLSPVDGALGVSLLPTFTWSAVADAMSYTIDLATDPNFTTIVQTATVSGPSYAVTTPLAQNSLHYWRVTPQNACGTQVSTTFSFTTAVISCVQYSSTNVPLPIPSTGTSGTTTSTLPVPISGAIIDVDVTLQGTHTWMGDLLFDLQSPTTISSTILDVSSCSSTQNFDLTLDDEASGPFPCPPVGGGAYQPSNPLSIFDGEDQQGIWTLVITDSASGDSGQLAAWSLTICSTEATPATATPTATATFTATPSSTPTATSTVTRTPTPIPTSTPTATATATLTQTSIPSPSSTSTFTATPTSTSTQTPTLTRTSTPTPSSTSTPTPTAPAIFTATPTPTPSPSPSLPSLVEPIVEGQSEVQFTNAFPQDSWMELYTTSRATQLGIGVSNTLGEGTIMTRALVRDEQLYLVNVTSNQTSVVVPVKAVPATMVEAPRVLAMLLVLLLFSLLATHGVFRRRE